MQSQLSRKDNNKAMEIGNNKVLSLLKLLCMYLSCSDHNVTWLFHGGCALADLAPFTTALVLSLQQSSLFVLPFLPISLFYCNFLI